MAFLLRHGRKVISCKKWLTSQPVSVCFQRQNLMHTPAAIQEPPKVLITGNNKKNLSAHCSALVVISHVLNIFFIALQI